MNKLEVIREKGLEILKAELPQLVTIEMDNGIFWRSLERYKKGDVIEHNGRKYFVQYDGWEWMQRFTISIYCAELEPEGVAR